MTDTPALNFDALPAGSGEGTALRFLLLPGSNRPQSLSHLLAEEVAHILRHLGGEARVFETAGINLDGFGPANPKAGELHEAVIWSDAQFWVSPEYYGSMSAVMKALLDSCPPAIEGQPLFAGKPLATAQICGAGPSFNTVQNLATVGRWLGMFVTPANFCLAHAQQEFGEDGRMKASAHYDKLVDLAQELYVTAVALKERRERLLDKYSARTKN